MTWTRLHQMNISLDKHLNPGTNYLNYVVRLEYSNSCLEIRFKSAGILTPDLRVRTGCLFRCLFSSFNRVLPPIAIHILSVFRAVYLPVNYLIYFLRSKFLAPCLFDN